jgi:hypothetical protein
MCTGSRRRSGAAADPGSTGIPLPVPVPQRDPQWCQDQVGDFGGGGMPAHDPLGEHVDDEGDVDEPAQVLQ